MRLILPLPDKVLPGTVTAFLQTVYNAKTTSPAAGVTVGLEGDRFEPAGLPRNAAQAASR